MTLRHDARIWHQTPQFESSCVRGSQREYSLKDLKTLRILDERIQLGEGLTAIERRNCFLYSRLEIAGLCRQRTSDIEQDGLTAGPVQLAGQELLHHHCRLIRRTAAQVPDGG